MAKTWCNKVKLLTSFKVTYGVILGVFSLHNTVSSSQKHSSFQVLNVSNLLAR